MMKGQERINAERERQINVEGYDGLHDNQYQNNELFKAGNCYYSYRRWGLDSLHVPKSWPWDSRFWKPTPDDRVRELEKAGALFKANYEIHNDKTSYDFMNRCANEIDEILKIRK